MMWLLMDREKELIVFGATHSPSNLAGRIVRVAHLAILALLVAACQDTAATQPIQQPPRPTPVAFMPVDDLLAIDARQPDREATTAGYLLIDHAGAILVGSMSFTADGAPRLIEGDTSQIWLGTGIETTLKGQLRTADGLAFATVRARGRLEGPGSYGPGGRYSYQMKVPSIELLTARETTIDNLLDDSAGNEGQLVRLTGGLIAGDSSALLVEQLGSDGLPAPKARQIKLRAPLQDRELLRRLKGVSAGTIRFGQVQVEGFWRGGILLPLSIVLVT